MNMERPLVPGPPTPSTPAGRASTRWTMFSLRSCSPEVMKRLTPSMFHEPSALGVALLRPAPTSEPASGSVRTIVAPHSRSTMISAIRWSRSLPARCTTAANAGPQPYIQTGALDPSTSSAMAQFRLEGAGVPPSASGICRRQYSESIQAR